MDSISLNGIKTYPFESKEQLLSFVEDEKKILIAINAEKIMKRDKVLVDIINRNIGYPDGVGAVLALKKKGCNAVKIPGVELWLDIIKNNYKSKSFYLIGAKEEIIKSTVEKLKDEFEGINIKGFHNGYFDEEGKTKILNDIKEKRPDIIFLALGSPKQEKIMNEFLREYPALYMGLGGSFDVYTGKIERAPKLFLTLGLEWLYRLLKEPTRIKRQVVLIKFLIYLFLNRF